MLVSCQEICKDYVYVYIQNIYFGLRGTPYT